MNEKIAKRWAKALLNKKHYPQIKGFLRTGEGFSVMGVLLDIYLKTTNNGKWLIPKEIEDVKTPISFVIYEPYKFTYNNYEIIPIEVKIWAEMRSYTGFRYINEDVIVDLVNDNDDGVSFKELHETILKYYEQL